MHKPAKKTTESDFLLWTMTLVKDPCDLRDEAVNKHIESENVSEFRERNFNALKRVPCDGIDKTIASLSKRVDAVIESGGYRTKY